MPPIPRDPAPDSTLALLARGYTFIPIRCQRFQSDLFETRLMLTKAVCMTGESAARLFYTEGRFTRRGAMPRTTLTLLQDFGSVQLLDGQAHRHRKHVFLCAMRPERLQALDALVRDTWREAIPRWQHRVEGTLLDEVQAILCQAVCRWAGVPLSETEATQRTREFAAMIDGAGAVGPRNWWGQVLRRRTERWAQNLIEQVRAGALQPPEDGALTTIAQFRDPQGRLLDARDAAVELINILRPVVAVANFIVFVALALHDYPDCRERLRSGDRAYRTWFVQEVRRFYPFFPFIGGKALQSFDWHGHHFTEGDWVLLDLYGTNHDPRIWGDPHVFRPERFRHWNGDRYTFIPQGGGDYATTHRCPGEPTTIGLMETATDLLTTAMQYKLLSQDLRVDLARMPALPKSRIILSAVERLS